MSKSTVYSCTITLLGHQSFNMLEKFHSPASYFPLDVTKYLHLNILLSSKYHPPFLHLFVTLILTDRI